MLRSLLRFFWMALVLALVALASALTAMRFAIHGREITVPDMQGKSPAEARQMADADGLGLKVEREYYSSKVPEGRVLSQVPAAGTVVRRGWELRVALSLGPQRVDIPGIVGQSERAAAIRMAQRGLNLGSTASMEVSGVDPGQVVAQNPPPNATNISAPKISLLVSEPPSRPAFVMPSFIGQTLGTSTVTLEGAGFSVGKVTLLEAPLAQPSENVPPPAEIGQANAPPSPPPSPSDIASATNASGANASATNASATTASATTAPPQAIVVSQDPKPGEKILAGSAVNLVVR